MFTEIVEQYRWHWTRSFKEK